MLLEAAADEAAKHSAEKLEVSIKGIKESQSASGRDFAVRSSVFNGLAQPLLPRDEVFEGFDEVGSRFEADFVKRHRCARNHVRRLLRGRGWYEAQLFVVKEDKKAKKAAMKKAKVMDEDAAKEEGGGGGSSAVAVQDERFVKLKVQKNRRKPLEGPESFFFPQRLMMACALSCWICTMLTLIIVNIGDWGVTVLSTASRLGDTVTAHAAYSDQLQYANRFGLQPTIFLMGLSLAGLSPEVQDFLRTAFLAATAVAGIVMILVFTMQWRWIFSNFKSDVFALRRGEYFFAKDKFREEYANKYIGYQVHPHHLAAASSLLLPPSTYLPTYSSLPSPQTNRSRI